MAGDKLTPRRKGRRMHKERVYGCKRHRECVGFRTLTREINENDIWAVV
jgi:hypothetical protein